MTTNYLDVAARIIRRCQDTDVSHGAGPGGPIDSLTQKLSRSEISRLIDQLDYESRGEPDQYVRHRYHNVADFLRSVLERHNIVDQKRKIARLAHVAQSEKRETCDCGVAHPPGANFYVTATDGKKVVALAGPYPTHAEAVAMVDQIKEMALKIDPSTAFASFGTTAMSSNYTKPGIFTPLPK
jgi:hypothetical protein